LPRIIPNQLKNVSSIVIFQGFSILITQFVLLVVITLSSGHYDKTIKSFDTDAACQKERAKEWKKFEAKELKELLASGEEFWC